MQSIFRVINDSSDEDLIKTLAQYHRDIKKSIKKDVFCKYLYSAYYDPRLIKVISKIDENSSPKAMKVKMGKNKRLLKMIQVIDKALSLNKSIVEKYQIVGEDLFYCPCYLYYNGKN